MIEEVEKYFDVYHFEKTDKGYRFYVIPKADETEIRKFLSRLSYDYDVSLKYRYGEYVLEISRAEKKERIWLNIVLLIATIATTTAVGSTFYGEEINITGGFMFSLAIMFVLGSHEMGHYIAAKRWKMRTSLPYFIPFPSLIGTLGAVIKHRGAIPNRRALFDVGVSGPLAGILASIIVVAIGLQLPFELKGKPMIYISTPPLFNFVVYLIKPEILMKKFASIHPVAFAGWVGLFVTFLNMIPVGQLDGGHVLRAMMGKKADIVSRIVPIVLITFGIIVSKIYNQPDSIWIFWGFITFFFSLHGHPEPIDDETPLDLKRMLIGLFAFLLAILCFTPTPFLYAVPTQT